MPNGFQTGANSNVAGNGAGEEHFIFNYEMTPTSSSNRGSRGVVQHKTNCQPPSNNPYSSKNKKSRISFDPEQNNQFLYSH